MRIIEVDPPAKLQPILRKRDHRSVLHRIEDFFTDRRQVEGKDYDYETIAHIHEFRGSSGKLVMEDGELAPELGVKLKTPVVADVTGETLLFHGLFLSGWNAYEEHPDHPGKRVYMFHADYYEYPQVIAGTIDTVMDPEFNSVR